MEIRIGLGSDFDVDVVKKTSRSKKGKHLGGQSPKDYTLIDIESTGLDPVYDDIIEISAIKVRDHKVTDQFSELIINETQALSDFITELTGISQELIDREGIDISSALNSVVEFIGNDIILGYHVNFDYNFLYDAAIKNKSKLITNDYIDILQISRKVHPNLERHRLKDMISFYSIDAIQEHRGLSDCIITKDVYDRHLNELIKRGVKLTDLYSSQKPLSSDDFKATVDNIDDSNPIYDYNICFTGKMDIVRKDLYQILKNLGAHPQNNVTLKTDYLVVGDLSYAASIKNNKSNKIKRAEKLISKEKNIQILTETVFMDMISEYLENAKLY